MNPPAPKLRFRCQAGLTALALVLALLMVALALGCTVYTSPLDVSKSKNLETPSPSTWENPTQLIHGLPIGDPEVGHQVGNLVPNFTLGLADGSTITSAQLVEEGRPTFLFFFATT